MGWTKRSDALAFLREKREYHYTFAWVHARRPYKGGGHHYGAYKGLCKMLGEPPEIELTQIYGEQDENNARGSRGVRGSGNRR
jgi:hypothetical protein